MTPHFLTIDPDDGMKVLKGLASPVRIRILKLLHEHGRLNVNDISHRLELPQSTVATNIQVLEKAGLVATETINARKGQQKICSARYDEILVRFDAQAGRRDDNLVEVSMPLGLFTSAEVSAPCGLCSTTGILGLLDVPDSFLDPSRVQAALAWFGAHPQEPVDLLVTDQNMPGMAGVDVVRELRRLRPALRMAIVSGHVSDALIAEATAAGVDEVLAKQDSMDALGAAIRGLLEPATGTAAA